MKLAAVLSFLVILIVAVSCDCGCLKCGKNLRVVSPPAAPIKVIYRGTACNCAREIPYKVETPVIKTETCAPRTYCYKCQAIELVKPPAPKPLYSYNYQVEVPVHKNPKPCFLYGLVASPDRVVMPAKGCEAEKPCATNPVFTTLREAEEEDFNYGGPYVNFASGGCSCGRYGRRKRSLMYYTQPLKTRLLLASLKAKAAKVKCNLIKKDMLRLHGKVKPTMINPLHNRFKRDYYQVTEVEDSGDTSNLGRTFYDNFNLDQIFPQIPLFYFINTPITMLKHFDRLKDHFVPVVDCVPKVLHTSKRYITNFGRKFQRSAMDFASRFMGTFRRSKRDTSSFLDSLEILNYKMNDDGTADLILYNKNSTFIGSNMALVFENFGNETGSTIYLAKIANGQHIHQEEMPPRKKRVCKRSLLKLVDKNEIRELLRAKFSEEDVHSDEDILDNHFNSIPKFKEAMNPNKFKVTLQKFDAKSFMKKTPHSAEEYHLEDLLKPEEIVGSTKHMDHLHPEKASDLIKAEISSTLKEIQNLVHADLEPTMKLYTELFKLQQLKTTLANDWKKGIQNNKAPSKSNILMFIKQLQKLINSLTKSTSNVLASKDQFCKCTLVDVLVSLFKTKLIFERIQESFGEKLKMGAKISSQEELFYISHINKIKFLDFEKNEIESNLKQKRDERIQSNVKRLEKLRQYLDRDDHDEIVEMAKLVQEMNHVKKLQLGAIKDLSKKIRYNQSARREIKIVHDFEKQLYELEEELCKEEEIEEEVVEEVNGYKKEKFDFKEFLKGFEAKRAAFLEKIKIHKSKD